MSVKIMGLVWDWDIPRDEKFVLLAYADHASHDGDNVYPSIGLIAQKTGYSERSVQTITRKLQKMGLLIADGKGKNGTNKWKIPPSWGAEIAPAEFAGVQNQDAGGAESNLEGVQPAAPEPLKPSVLEPSVKRTATPKPAKPTQPKATDFPEVVLYREVAGLYPTSEVFELVVESIHKVKARLGREVTKEDLLPFRKSWVSKGYNRFAITWLEWAETGQIPQNGTWKSRRETPQEPKGFDAARKFLERMGANG